MAGDQPVYRKSGRGVPFCGDKKKCPVSKDTIVFSWDGLGLEWNYLGTPYSDFVKLKDDGLHLRMLKKGLVPEEFEGKIFDYFEHVNQIGFTKENMPFIGQRMKEPDFFCETTLRVCPINQESAGMVILQNNACQIRVEIKRSETQELVASVVTVKYQLIDNKMHYEKEEAGTVKIAEAKEYCLAIEGKHNYYTFTIVSGKRIVIAENVDGTFLGSESAGGFIGSYIGLWASSNGNVSENEAVFVKFTLKNFSQEWLRDEKAMDPQN